MNEIEDLLNVFEKVVVQFMDLPFPTVALINGHAYGGGFLFSVAHDFRVMNSTKGWVCIPAVTLGLKLPLVIIQILKDKIGPVRAKEMILLGKKYTGDQALHMNLVDKVYPENEMLEKTIEFIEKEFPKNLKSFSFLRKSLYHSTLEVVKSKL